MNKTITFLICFIFCLIVSRSLVAQNRLAAFEMNTRLGRGVNMGNSFEAPTETAWGNPWKPEYFKIMADLGFSHVRLPIRWEPAERSSDVPPYIINPIFLNRIKTVVDEALKNKLHIIINMHHHEALYADPAGQRDRFLSQWGQIATFFKDYPDSLLFEVLNEPHGNMTADLWNQYFADALAEIRKTNPTRVVLMGIANYGGLSGLPQLVLPDDEYIIVSPHYYNPFSFTHQGAEWVDGADAWLGTKWDDTEADRDNITNEFSYAIEFSKNQHVPIHVGEFGSYSKADIDSRSKWTTYLSRWFEEQGFSWAYWEFSAGFGIYNPDTKELNTPLVDALFNNEMPDPTPVFYTPLYTSDFSAGKDGWALSVQNGAAGSMSANNNKLEINLSSGGTEGWHAQLVKNGFALENGVMYRISFAGSSSGSRNVNFYAGKASDPWTAYSGYNSVSLSTKEQTYRYTFTMMSPSDPAARLVFDLGKSAENVTISWVKIEKVSFVITGLNKQPDNRQVQYYPNPVTTELHIPHLQQYKSISIADLNGRKVQHWQVRPGVNALNMQSLPAGIYVVSLTGVGLNDRFTVIRQ